MANKMNPLSWIAIGLLIIGGINWGLIGGFEYNLVESLLGQWEMVVRVVYGLVGVSAIFSIFALLKLR